MSFKKLPLFLVAVLFTLCSSSSYAYYLNTRTMIATGNPGTDTTGWVDNSGTKADNTMQVSNGGVPQRAWAVMKPGGVLPPGAVIASAVLSFNITNVVNAGAATYKITYTPQDVSTYAGLTLYNTLDPASVLTLASWGTTPGMVNLNVPTATVATFFAYTAVSIGWIETSGSTSYTISGETSGASFAPRLTVSYYIPCTGTPTAGTASSTASVICPNTPFTLSDVGYTVDTGIVYNWQSSAALAGPFTDIAGATNPASYLVPAQATTTYYRLRTTCSFSTLSGFSNVITVTENPPTSCYCIPNPGGSGCTAGDGINNFVLVGEGPGISDFGTGCHANAYDDRTLESVSMMQCVSYSGIITKITNNGQTDNLNIWIDFNDDGIFSPSESVCTATNITSVYPGPNNFTIAIPTGATTGNHRMRVMVGRGVAPASFDPCNAGPVWNFGETHDYTANILPIIVLNTPIVAGNANVCAGSCISLTANVANANAGTQYIWTYPPSFTPVITTNPTLNICPSALNNTGNFSVRAFYGCDTTPAGVVPVTVFALPVATPTTNTPVCTGSTLTLDGDNNAYTYEWQGPVGFDVFGQHQTRPNMQATYAGLYSMTVTDPASGCFNTFTTSVAVIITPTITLTPINPTTCIPGNDGQITVGGLTTGSFYDVVYTGPVNGTITNTAAVAGAITITGLVAGSYTVYVRTYTAPVCQSLNVSTTLSNPVYTITSTSPTNPTTCTPGNDGKIQLCGLPANTSGWTFTYNYNAVPQPPLVNQSVPANGCYTITGLSQGTYDNITANRNGCQTNIVGPVVLSNPTYTITNVTFVNPTNCVPGCDGTITISGLTANVSNQWNVFYTFNGNPTSVANRSTNGSGQIILTAMCEGTYTDFYVIRNGCQTNTWPGPVTLANPSYSLTSIASVNPTTCIPGNNGTITICGLPNNLSNCTVSYLKNGNPATFGPVTANATGCITITGLSAGTYDNVYVTRGGCITNALGPVTLTNPLAPVAVAASNSPVCSGDDINFTGNPAGNTYKWFNPLNVQWSTNQNPTITGSALSDAGTYTLIVSNAGGCADTTTTTVVVNKTPVLTSISFVNPNKCTTCNGSFTISGLDPNTAYTLHYLKNAVPQFPVNFTSTASGTYVRTNQCAGTYDNIYVTSALPANCPSNALGPITLVDPPLPPQPGANSNSPVCAGDTLKLTSTSATYNATYKWSGPAVFGNNVAGQNQNIPNVTAPYGGTYSVTVKDTFNCVSLPTTISVVIKPQPVITMSSNTPVCVGDTLKMYSTSDIPGSTVLWNYPDGPTSTLDSPIRLNAIPLYAGEYTVHYTSPFGCSSTDTTDVFIGNILLAGLSATSNSPLCSGDTLKLNAGVLVPGAQYSWTGPNGYSTPIADPIRTNIQVVDSGDYIVTAVLNGCQSSPDTAHVVVRQTTTASITITVDPSDTICVGDNVTFTATVTNGGTAPQYQWVKNGFWVLGAIDSFWGSPSLYNHDSIFCVFTSNQVCVTNPVDTSNTIGITLGNVTTPTVILTASTNVILPGQPITFTATAVNAGPNPTYEWFKNGILIPTATTNVYTAYNLTQNDQIKVVVHSSWTCAAVDTASAFWGNPNISLGTASLTGKESAITLYPNPNSGMFTVDGVFQDISAEKDIPVEVINALGQVVYHDKAVIVNSVLHMQFNLVDMPGGMYVLKLGIGNEARLLRFTVK